MRLVAELGAVMALAFCLSGLAGDRVWALQEPRSSVLLSVYDDMVSTAQNELQFRRQQDHGVLGPTNQMEMMLDDHTADDTLHPVDDDTELPMGQQLHTANAQLYDEDDSEAAAMGGTVTEKDTAMGADETAASTMRLRAKAAVKTQARVSEPVKDGENAPEPEPGGAVRTEASQMDGYPCNGPPTKSAASGMEVNCRSNNCVKPFGKWGALCQDMSERLSEKYVKLEQFNDACRGVYGYWCMEECRTLAAMFQPIAGDLHGEYKLKLSDCTICMLTKECNPTGRLTPMAG